MELNIKLGTTETREELYDLKRFIEIRDKIKKLSQLWEKKKNVSSLIIGKLRKEGRKIILDEDIIGRFDSTEEAKEFFELFAVIHGYTYNGETNLLFANDAAILGLNNKTESVDLKSEEITEKEKERIIKLARRKVVTCIEDAIGFYPDESNAAERIRIVFRLIGENDEDLLFIKNIIINITKLDEITFRKEIIEKAKKTKPEIQLYIGQEILFDIEEQKDIIRNVLEKSLDVNISPEANDVMTFFERFFKKYGNITWENSKMKYKITPNDKMD